MIRADDIMRDHARARFAIAYDRVLHHWPHVVALADHWAEHRPAPSSMEEEYALIEQYYAAAIADASPITRGCEYVVRADCEGIDSADAQTWPGNSWFLARGWRAWGETPARSEIEWVHRYCAMRSPYDLIDRWTERTVWRRSVNGYGPWEPHAVPCHIYRYGNQLPSIAHAICQALATGIQVTTEMLQQPGSSEDREAQLLAEAHPGNLYHTISSLVSSCPSDDR